MSENMPLSIQKIGLRNGVISGILSICYTLLLYIIGGELLFKTSMQLLGNVILIGMMILTIEQYRKANGKFISFKTAFGGAFSVAVFGILLPLIFGYLLYTVIDPDLVMRLKEYSIQQSIDMMQWMNAPEETIDETITKIKEQSYSPTIGRSAVGYVVALLFSALFAAIIALVFWLSTRKHEPVPTFESTTVIDQ